MKLQATLFKAADAVLGPPACLLLGWIDRLRARSGPPGPPRDVRRILVIRPGGLGDMVLLLPAIAALRRAFPSAEIDLVSETRNLAVLKLSGLADAALVYDANPIRFLLRLARRRYQVAVDTEQFHHFSAVFAYLSGAPLRAGFKINPRRNALYTHLIDYAVDGPESEQFMRLLAPLGIEDAPCRIEGLLCPPDESPRGSLGLPKTDGYAVVHAGASTPFKRWDPDGFAEVAEHLHRLHGLTTVLTGDTADRRVAERLVQALGRRHCPTVNVAGQMDLDAAAGSLAYARVFVGVDSGLAHLAVALGVPTVVLFGPSDSRKWGSSEPRHAVVKESPPCAPCFIFGYHKPCGHISCMRNLRVAPVIAACDRVLAEAASRAAATALKAP